MADRRRTTAVPEGLPRAQPSADGADRAERADNEGAVADEGEAAAENRAGENREECSGLDSASCLRRARRRGGAAGGVRI